MAHTCQEFTLCFVYSFKAQVFKACFFHLLALGDILHHTIYFYGMTFAIIDHLSSCVSMYPSAVWPDEDVFSIKMLPQFNSITNGFYEIIFTLRCQGIYGGIIF